MIAIRFFTDEDVYGAIAPALRKAGYEAISTPEAGRIHESDSSQLQWAADQGLTFVTFNVGHFAALHADWLSTGQDHAGVILSSQRLIGDTLHRLINLAKNLDAESMQNRLEFLGDW